MTCDSKDNVGATHNNAQLKNEIILPWKAPIFSEGPAKNIEFKLKFPWEKSRIKHN